jgi:hypothetical protein
MVNRCDKIEEGKFKVGSGEVIESGRRQRLKLADEIIAEVADCSSEKRRDIGRTGDARISAELGHVLKRG